MASPVEIRDLRDDERAWADAQYRAIQFAVAPAPAVALVAERDGARVGLGRLVALSADVLELGGIWTDDAARGSGIARTMVTTLLIRATQLGSPGPLWCIPFAHLGAFYRSFGFTDRAAPWPAAIAAKVAECIAHQLPEIVVLARDPMSPSR
jgi:GNAT superfamily N-acetyltransferase